MAALACCSEKIWVCVPGSPGQKNHSEGELFSCSDHQKLQQRPGAWAVGPGRWDSWVLRLTHTGYLWKFRTIIEVSLFTQWPSSEDFRLQRQTAVWWSDRHLVVVPTALPTPGLQESPAQRSPSHTSVIDMGLIRILWHEKPRITFCSRKFQACVFGVFFKRQIPLCYSQDLLMRWNMWFKGGKWQWRKSCWKK